MPCLPSSHGNLKACSAYCARILGHVTWELRKNARLNQIQMTNFIMGLGMWLRMLPVFLETCQAQLCGPQGFNRHLLFVLSCMSLHLKRALRVSQSPQLLWLHLSCHQVTLQGYGVKFHIFVRAVVTISSVARDEAASHAWLINQVGHLPIYPRYATWIPTVVRSTIQ